MRVPITTDERDFVNFVIECMWPENLPTESQTASTNPALRLALNTTFEAIATLRPGDVLSLVFNVMHNRPEDFKLSKETELILTRGVLETILYLWLNGSYKSSAEKAIQEVLTDFRTAYAAQFADNGIQH